MQLCLSARMFTIPGERDQFDLEMDAFIQFARAMGYDGITLRPGQLDSRTLPEEVDRISGMLIRNDMVCSFVMGETVGDRKSYEAHCELMDHALRIGCRHVQPSVRSASEIPWLQKLCDYAAEQGVRIGPQLHNNTLHDTVPRCLDLLKKVDRKNFGLNFEASHLLIQNVNPQGGKAVRALGDRIFTVCVQNYRMEGVHPIPCLPGDAEGVDFEDVFGTLKEIGFDGFVTHMSGRYPDMRNEDVCRAYVEALRPLMT